MINTNVLTIRISLLIDHHLEYNNEQEIIEDNFERLDKDYTRIF
jgi:transposase